MDAEGRRQERIEPAEAEAVLAARRELGPEFDAELVAGFAERVERAIEARAGAALAARQSPGLAGREREILQFVVTLVSVVACVPVGIVLGLQGELVAMLIAYAAILGVNIVVRTRR